MYHSLARPLPVGPHDVLYQVEFGAGAGLIRDVTALAHDPDASMERKALLYAAAAPIASQDADRLQRVINALAKQEQHQQDALACDQAKSSGWGSNVRTPLEAVAPMTVTGHLRAVRRADTGMSQEVKLELGAVREAVGRAILAGNPDIGCATSNTAFNMLAAAQ